MSKKIAVIGAGTAGVIAATHFNKWMKDYELEQKMNRCFKYSNYE